MTLPPAFRVERSGRRERFHRRNRGTEDEQSGETRAAVGWRSQPSRDQQSHRHTNPLPDLVCDGGGLVGREARVAGPAAISAPFLLRFSASPLLRVISVASVNSAG